MTRLLSPTDRCVEVDVGRRRYRGTRIEVTDPGDVALLRQAGYTEAGLAGVTRSGGFLCACGFRPFIRRCSRCGGEAQRA